MTIRTQADNTAKLRTRLLSGCTAAVLCGAVMLAGNLPAVAQTAAPAPDVGVVTPDPVVTDPVVPLLPASGDDDLDDQDDEDDLDDADDDDDDGDDDDDRDSDSDSDDGDD